MIKFAVAKLNPFVIGYNLLIFIESPAVVVRLLSFNTTSAVFEWLNA